MSTLENYNRGTRYLEKGKWEKALGCFKRETCGTKELYLNMGNAYRKLGNNEKAIENYLMANNPRIPDFDGNRGEYSLALGNLGLEAYTHGDNDLATATYLRALKLNPLAYDSIWNMSSSLLREWCSGGELHKDAWKMYDYRFKALKPMQTGGLPRWDWTPVGSLLVVADQGFGDKIMFGRYLKMCMEDSRVGKMTLFCDASVSVLFDCDTVQDMKGTYDACVPMSELAAHYGMIPGDYLASKYPKKSNLLAGVNVAVEWAGSETHANNMFRSCFPSYFSGLAMEGVNLFNIRPGAKPVKNVKLLPSTGWDCSAQLLATMDLVISVDTSIVHLAGSLGVETWMIQPTQETDFRWGLNYLKDRHSMPRENNLWYDSVKVIDNTGWDATFKHIKERLEKYVQDRRG